MPDGVEHVATLQQVLNYDRKCEIVIDLGYGIEREQTEIMIVVWLRSHIQSLNKNHSITGNLRLVSPTECVVLFVLLVDMAAPFAEFNRVFLLQGSDLLSLRNPSESEVLWLGNHISFVCKTVVQHLLRFQIQPIRHLKAL